jgi:hypothetical protein
LKKADAVEVLFREFDEALRSAGFPAMSGQIVDATIVAAPKQRNTIEEKKAIKEGRVPEEWKDKPARRIATRVGPSNTRRRNRARTDRRLRSTSPSRLFGYKNRVSIDRAHGLIRTWTATHAAAHDGARLEDILDRTDTASEVWADTAYR